MAEITQTQLHEALRKADCPLMPAPGEDASADISAAGGVVYECVPGQTWFLSAHEDFFLGVAADENATASAANMTIPKGLVSFTVPNGVASFAIFSSEPGALGGAWKG